MLTDGWLNARWRQNNATVKFASLRGESSRMPLAIEARLSRRLSTGYSDLQADSTIMKHTLLRLDCNFDTCPPTILRILYLFTWSCTVTSTEHWLFPKCNDTFQHRRVTPAESTHAQQNIIAFVQTRTRCQQRPINRSGATQYTPHALSAAAVTTSQLEEQKRKPQSSRTRPNERQSQKTARQPDNDATLLNLPTTTRHMLTTMR